MPKLNELKDMHINVIVKWIVSVPHSKFYQFNPNEISNHLDRNGAIRYLWHLILVNDKNKSKLKSIDEGSSIKEISVFSASNPHNELE